MQFLSRAAGIAVMCLLASSAWAQQAPSPPPKVGQASKDSVWVPTPERLVRRMLQMADTTKDDVVIDLGAGDGRIPIYAARHFGALGIAVELEENLVQLARSEAAREGVANRVRVIKQDLFEADLSTATVVALYINVMDRLKPVILKLRPGTRVVSHAFDFGDWEPDETIVVEERKGYLWVVPAAVEGTWRVSVSGQDLRLRLRQRYQKLEATGERDGREIKVLGPRLRGTEIHFSVFDRDGEARHYSGRLEGGRIAGESRNWVGTALLRWSAVRERE